MTGRRSRSLSIVPRLIAPATLTTALLMAAPVALADSPSYAVAKVGAFGGEPTMAAGPSGELYDTTPSGGTILYRSKDAGATWQQTATADPNSGDDCVTTDQSGALYECNLAGSPSAAPLQADVWKSTDDGNTWSYGNNNVDSMAGQNLCGTSCQPFGVDRQWADAYIPPGGTTGDATVVLAYHDFYGPSQIWVNVSRDGGKTFGQSEDVLANTTSQGGSQAAVAMADSACNTVPIGARIEKTGPHPGRMYVAWIASDPESPVTGCNVTMVQSFHNLFVAWSDDNGATWTPQLAYDAGVGHDASTPFASFTLDNQGNPYIGFTTPAPADNPVACAGESTGGTVQSDPTCAYHIWVVWSANGGSLWDGGGGQVPGSAGSAYEVDPSSSAQTDVFPAIAAGDPGKVDVAWLQTDETEPSDPLGKFDPGGCAGPGPANGNPTFYPPTCNWNLFAGQSLDLTSPPDQASWTTSRVTSTPMHVGDICNLGIFCVSPASNRNLLDFISEAVDPTTGLAHIAYADDNQANAMMAANQTSGQGVLATPAGAAGSLAAGLTAALGAGGAPGGNGAPGQAGSPGPRGPRGRSPGAVFAIAAYQATATARRIVVRFILTRPAAVVLMLSRKGKRPVVLARARGREGLNRITWNGRTGPRRLRRGTYRLIVRATAGGRTRTSSLVVRIR